METIKKNPLLTKNQLYIGGAVVLIALIFVLGNYFGKTSKTKKQIEVQVDIKDENGNTVVYYPNELLERLNKGLTTRYYFDFSERCEPIEELYALDSIRFMAAVKAYRVKYGEDLKTHMEACHVGCGDGGPIGTFNLIYNRINSLKDIIK
jgi:hypothetical protein